MMQSKRIYNLLQSAKTEQEFYELLEISLTDKEQAMLVERWRILEELAKGNSQRKVAETLSCSVVTVTRGAKVLRNNERKIRDYLNRISTEKKLK